MILRMVLLLIIQGTYVLPVNLLGRGPPLTTTSPFQARQQPHPVGVDHLQGQPPVLLERLVHLQEPLRRRQAAKHMLVTESLIVCC